MKILILTQWFEPEPCFKGLSFAKALAAKGHQVQVLTGFPNYPEGKLYPGYRLKPVQIEWMDGISVVRVPLFPSHDHSALKRVANYISFAVSSALVRTRMLQSPDVLYVYHPPATIGLSAIILKKRLGVPMVYDVQDMWPDSLTATNMISSSLVLQLIDGWCRLVYRFADRLVVLSPGFKRLLTCRGVPAEKIEVIYNWCEEDLLRPQLPDRDLARQLGFKDSFTVLFAGNMGPAQALDAVLLAAQKLKIRVPQVQFVFIGGGVSAEALRGKADRMELENVRFLPRLPMREIGAVLNLADLLLVHLRRDRLFEITVPSKTQAYMAVEKPILMGVRGDAAMLVHCSGAGLACEPEDPESIANAVVRFHDMSPQQRLQMGRRGRRFYLSEMSRRSGIERFETVFRQLVQPETAALLNNPPE